nr:immunoglobulin light chain junction region [Macaca mulatta]
DYHCGAWDSSLSTRLF